MGWDEWDDGNKEADEWYKYMVTMRHILKRTVYLESYHICFKTDTLHVKQNRLDQSSLQYFF